MSSSQESSEQNRPRTWGRSTKCAGLLNLALKCDTSMWECETAARGGGDTFDLDKTPAGARGGRERSDTFSAFGGGKRIASGEGKRVLSDMT